MFQLRPAADVTLNIALFKQAKTRALLIMSCDDSGALAEISYSWQERKKIGLGIFTENLFLFV